MIPYTVFTLDNGLRVVHSYDPQTPLAVVDVLYDTGARDEREDLTGIAHLFEHLMFGGSKHVAQFDDTLQEAGGTSNAFTGNDFTEFYDLIPTQNIETALYLESDRMLAVDLSQKALDVQQHVVIEEFKQTCLNRPYGKVMHELRRLLYSKHPYRWPVIGIEPEHIERVTRADALEWHRLHYAPNNAILTIVGNISLERAKVLVEKWFGDIPAQALPKRHLQDDPWLTAPARACIIDDVPQTSISMGYRMDGYGERGYFAADAISDILSAGKSSRFYQRLVMGTGLFTNAHASIIGSEHSGFFFIDAQVSHESGEAIRQAEQMLIDECRQLAEPGNVTAYELERTKSRYEATFAFDNLAPVQRAQNLAAAVYHGEDINDNVARYRSLTLDDISATARRLFIDHAPAIVLCRPLSTV